MLLRTKFPLHLSKIGRHLQRPPRPLQPNLPQMEILILHGCDPGLRFQIGTTYCSRAPMVQRVPVLYNLVHLLRFHHEGPLLLKYVWDGQANVCCTGGTVPWRVTGRAGSCSWSWAEKRSLAAEEVNRSLK